MAAAAYPPWVMLEFYCTREIDGCSSSMADANTLARCRTTAGHPINVSLCLEAPPDGSRVCVQLPAGVEVSYGVVVAAHGDSMLIQVPIKNRGGSTIDHFVYNAGDSAAQPPRLPSLLLLPPHCMHTENTGLLRCGEDGFLVAELRMELRMESVMEEDETMRDDVELHLLQSSSGEWCVKRLVVSRYSDGGETMCVNLASWWQNSIVVPVGDHMLCWVDLASGFLFSDNLLDESPRLRYVPLPEDANLGPRSVCVTADDAGTIKFVNVFPRCCCGAAGKCYCTASSRHHAYAVHTWTLRMDDMTWAMDGSLDATQLWSLDGYNGLPRVQLDIPIVSLDEADTICFEVREKHQENHGDETLWRIMVDMKSRTLRSVFRYPEGRWFCRWVGCHPLSSRVSRYFNSKPSSGQPPGPAAQQAEATLNLTNTRIMRAASPDESAILAALQDIPGLDRDDMLKAYRILTHDDSGRRFRSLMGLPMDFRKDCVLMEIKASEACLLCSACSADLQVATDKRMKR